MAQGPLAHSKILLLQLQLAVYLPPVRASRLLGAGSMLMQAQFFHQNIV